MAWREVAGEFVVVNLATRTMIGLNPPGGAILELLGTAAVPDTLAARFGSGGDSLADRAVAVETFCEELRTLGVVETATDADLGAEPRADSRPVSWNPPRVVWQEPLTAVVGQSPPPHLGDPSCGF